GTASDVVVPVTTPFRNCVFNATGIQTADLVEYALPHDGNSGAYAALLNRISITATQYSLTSTDSTCNGFAASVGPAFVNQASVALAAALRPPLEAVTLGESVCPLQ
ncbi:MAG TPA: hypothetical protein VND91_05365, partial [Candidatus Saccharimonadia bacterium]|nr:hypothetical protein [Candidatus Saccharimonadia bacterium]